MFPPEAPPDTLISDNTELVTGLPHSRESEEAVVGSVLIRPSCFSDVAQFLKPEDFYLHRLRFVWESFIRLNERHAPIDTLTVSEELDDMGHLEEIGGAAYLASLLNQVPTTLHVEAYGRIVEACAIRRKLLVAANTIAALAYDESEDIKVVTTSAEQAVLAITDKRLRSGDVTAHDAASALYDHVDRLAKNDTPPGVLTGHIDFDGFTGGLIPGTSGLVAARPGVGKTSLLLNWVVFIMEHNPVPTVFNSMEMSSRGLTARLASLVAGIDSEKVKKGTLTDEDWPAFNHAIETISNWPLVIIDERDPLSLLSKVTHMRANGECDLLMNDYIGKFEAKAESRVRQVGIASQTVSKIAVRLDIPVVSAAQVSRTIDTRGKDSELVLSDLKETGDLEQDADWVLFLNPCTEPTMQNIRNCRLAKQREGPVGTFSLIFRANLTKFENATTRHTVSLDDVRDDYTDK